MSELHSLSLVEAAAQLQAKTITPTQLVKACLERIRNTEPTLNACLHICEQTALQEAAQKEQIGPQPNQPLWGVPITLKDNICTKGIPTTCGSSMLQNFIPPYSATVAERLTHSGAILLAKTNMDDFAMGNTTQSSLTGSTHNPWNTDRVPGGSSGGSAASVASGQSFGSVATDTGGSIRLPAAACGCVGLKPTYGRVSRYGVTALASSLDHVGTLARTVSDCAALFTAIAGYDEKDATSATLPLPDMSIINKTVSLKGITLGVLDDFWQEDVSAEVNKECTKALQLAQELGATIQHITLPHIDCAVAAYTAICSAEASTSLARFDGIRFGKREVQATINGVYEKTRSTYLSFEAQCRILFGTHVLSGKNYQDYFVQAAKVRRLIHEEYRAALHDCHALVLPSCPITAWATKELAHKPEMHNSIQNFTVGANLSGLPALSIPTGLGETSQMPVGLQIIGRAYCEHDLLAIGHALEQALPTLGLPQV